MLVIEIEERILRRKEAQEIQFDKFLNVLETENCAYGRKQCSWRDESKPWKPTDCLWQRIFSWNQKFFSPELSFHLSSCIHISGESETPNPVPGVLNEKLQWNRKGSSNSSTGTQLLK